jgi:hypothetical protein
MALPEYRWVSVEEYLAIDNASEVRFEYVHGQLRMLAGGSRNYALIAQSSRFTPQPPARNSMRSLHL